MTNTNYYKFHKYNNIEIAISLEDSNDKKCKCFIPALTPFLEHDTPYDKIDPPSSTLNIISGTKNMEIKPCITSNYIELKMPEYIGKITKGDKFTISFIGGDINKPYVLGRYDE